MNNRWILIIFVVASLALMVACGANNAPTKADQAGNQPENVAESGNDTADNTQEQVEEPESSEEEEAGEQEGQGFTPLSPEPQAIEITTSDDRRLEGRYYPAAVPGAPVVVLMHWAPGSMDDWNQIAPWLQNRGAGGEDWFPEMPAGVSFAVITFNFGGYGRSESGGSRQSYLDDAVAALNFAASLDGVDPHRITAIGASIGADGSVDSCYLFNDAGEMGSCIGALSLSPGNYLTNEFDYGLAAQMVDKSSYPVWCFAAENDYISPDLCRGLAGESSQAFIYQGGDHGMDLITADHFPSEPTLDFNPVELIQEFLETAYGMTLNEFSLP